VSEAAGEVQSAALKRLLEGRGDAVLEHHERLGDATAVVRADRIVDVMRFLRDADGLQFDMLSDLTGVDYLGREPRFEVVYHLYSLERKHRLRIKAAVPEDPCEIDSIQEVWPAANWMEREAWDMYGIRFRNHGDLRRLLLYEEFEGHPLRKDYPKEKRQPLIGPRN
jgi:NADH-quinone oxidoreductase subunit C